MRNNFGAIARHLAAGVAAIAILPVSAFAQAASAEEETGDSEIVVTGTILRGAAPVGSSQISVDASKIAEQGATTSNELLATIPQVSNLFNTVPSSRLDVAQNQIQVVRPNLRSLSPETGSSSSTLVLFDGHRIAGVGVTQSATDPELIPTGAIERVEIVTDGGSATYGSDAVGGVINFITRKRFDGLKLDAKYGIADNYYTFDTNLTAGRDWGSGSLYASVMYQKNDAIFGRDRDFIQQKDFNTNVPTERRCSPGNLSVNGPLIFEIPGVFQLFGPGASYALPNLTTPATTPNACDATNDSTFVPEAERYSGIVSLHQELNDQISVDVRAFYGQRTTRSVAPLRSTAVVTSSNAFYTPVAANPTGAQTVNLSYESVLGLESSPRGTKFSEFGVNTELTADLTDNWQLRSLFNYSESDSSYFIVGTNQALQQAAGSSSNPQTAVNFYNLAATPNQSLIAAIANSETAGQGRDSLFNVRAIIDGKLIELPGGYVRVAIGYEYLHDSFQQRVAPPNGVRGAYRSVPFTPYRRHVNSFFGELQVPIFEQLIIAGSVRHDMFSDFGSTTNPKIGVTFKPLDWLKLRGNYSTSFNAPGAVDQLGSQRNNLSFFPFNAFVRPGDTPNVTGTLAIQGSQPNLVPQTAKTYSLGFDIDPPVLSGLHASANYYNVKFSNLLGIPTPNAGIYNDFPNNIISNVNGLSADQLRAFAALAPNGPGFIENFITSGQQAYAAVQFLTGNYGILKVDGFDFDVNYRTQTGFGGIDAGIAGNYTLNRKSQVSSTTPIVDVLAFDTSRLQLQATLGADIGHFRAQATLNHSQGFDVRRSVTLPQDKVGDFNVVNLFFKYDVPGDSGLLKNLAFTLNINNIFDTDPPLYKLSTDNGYANGFTLGRLVMLGISKKF